MVVLFVAFPAVFFAAFFAVLLVVFFAAFFVAFFAAFLAVFLIAFLAAFLVAFFVAFLAVFLAAWPRPAARSWPALRFTLLEARLPGLAATPSRRARDRPIAMACFRLLADPSPAWSSSISSRTYSPACVLLDLPARLSSCAALCAVFLLGMESSRCVRRPTYSAARVNTAWVSAGTTSRQDQGRAGKRRPPC
ncbi:MAG: hypothetical protein DI597_04230 [Pseudoxanthomonas spadix]|nr:MAG: hypothetical protein DI597_04230 [Pseudoxanthomonas spadix]